MASLSGNGGFGFPLPPKKKYIYIFYPTLKCCTNGFQMVLLETHSCFKCWYLQFDFQENITLGKVQFSPWNVKRQQFFLTIFRHQHCQSTEFPLFIFVCFLAAPDQEMFRKIRIELISYLMTVPFVRQPRLNLDCHILIEYKSFFVGYKGVSFERGKGRYCLI